jgi:serine/threonine protein phosphatase PrpC
MIWAGQFGIEDGEAREETPWVGAFPDPAADEEPSDLYLVLEPALPGSEEFCSEMKEAVSRVFHKSKLSLTGGLLRALHAAHEQLRDWNRRSIKEHHVATGVSCLAVRDGEAYLALAGPSAAAVYRDGAVSVLSPVIPEAREPLGLPEDIRPDFTRHELTEGSRILLLSPSLRDALSADDLASALALGPEDALPELYRRARDLANCGAILVASVSRPDPEEAAAP